MIVSVGSINMDLVVQVGRAPAEGETVLGSDYVRVPGGKGANQAAAAARLGATVHMVGAVGSDGFAGELVTALEQSGVDVSNVQRQPGASGVAFITVERDGQNRIIVSPGANSRLAAQPPEAAVFTGAEVVLLQLEIPAEVVLSAAALGRAAGARVLLNAAPPLTGIASRLTDVDVLIVNEVEAGILLDQPRADSVPRAHEYAARLSRFAPDVVVTLGSLGAVWYSTAGGPGELPAFPVEVVDTTAAGDAFVGAMAVALSEGRTLAEAVEFGSAAGALAVTVRGAQLSLPRRADVEALLKKKGVSP